MTQSSASPLRLLVVEDEALLRWAIAETLTAAGHQVVQAGDAAAARRAITEEAPVDAVLLDFRLPDSNDLTLLADIRRLSPPTAVVMMTAHGTPEMLEGARALGVYDILSKPFDVRVVAPTLTAALRSRPH
jgi:DNA-binding NtrC family response regulator